MSSAETFHRVRVQNARERNPAVQQSVQLLPGLAPLLTATKQDVSPQYAQPVLEQRQPIGVARNRVVAVITQYDLLQPSSDLRRRCVNRRRPWLASSIPGSGSASFRTLLEEHHHRPQDPRSGRAPPAHGQITRSGAIVYRIMHPDCQWADARADQGTA